MIAFDFDRAKMRRRLTTYSAILLGGYALMVSAWCLLLFRVIGQGWAWAVIVPIFFTAMHSAQYAQWVGIFGRGLKR